MPAAILEERRRSRVTCWAQASDYLAMTSGERTTARHGPHGAFVAGTGTPISALSNDSKVWLEHQAVPFPGADEGACALTVR